MSKTRKRTKKKVRGTALTAAIVFVMLHGLLMTIAAISTKHDVGEVSLPVTYTLFVLSSIASAVAGYALWQWKSWGLNLYLGASVVTMALATMLTGSIMAAFWGLIPFAVVGYIVRMDWDKFDK